MEVNAICIWCEKSVTITVKPEDWERYRTTDDHVQDIFPYLNDGEREMLISSTCEDCWNRMMGGLFNDDEL